MTKISACNKGKALHISQWIKGELGAVGGDRVDPEQDEDGGLELWPEERMRAKQEEVQRRLEAARDQQRGCDVIIEDTVSMISSPDDSQVGQRQV